MHLDTSCNSSSMCVAAPHAHQHDVRYCALLICLGNNSWCRRCCKDIILNVLQAMHSNTHYLQHLIPTHFVPACARCPSFPLP